MGDWEVKQEVELCRDSSHRKLLTQGHLGEPSAGMGRKQPGLMLREYLGLPDGDVIQRLGYMLKFLS